MANAVIVQNGVILNRITKQSKRKKFCIQKLSIAITGFRNLLLTPIRPLINRYEENYEYFHFKNFGNEQRANICFKRNCCFWWIVAYSITLLSFAFLTIYQMYFFLLDVTLHWSRHTLIAANSFHPKNPIVKQRQRQIAIPGKRWPLFRDRSSRMSRNQGLNLKIAN